MIVCPNCNHQNPEGAVQCEACYTPLPAMTTCPNCGATVQTDASFCGQCGFNLRAAGITSAVTSAEPLNLIADAVTSPVEIPDPVAEPNSQPASASSVNPNIAMETTEQDLQAFLAEKAAIITEAEAPEIKAPEAEVFEAEVSAPQGTIAPPAEGMSETATQLQQQTAKLLHVQTNTSVELPSGIAVVHIGKPNDRIPPDIDVSGFPNSEIVSRIHADIRMEGDAYYVEDMGSSNGTYINNLPLSMGNRHKLRPGDRIGLGKGDKVTFLFQIS
jgi:predicted component of type VI protein secretion system